MRASFGMLGGESVGVLIYLALTPSNEHRGAIEVIVALTLGIAIIGVIMAGRVAKKPWNASYSLTGTLAAGFIVTVCCALDGGIDSPLIYFAILPVVSAALALPVKHVAICAAAAAVQVAFLAAFDSDVTSQGGTLILLFSFVMGVSAFAMLSTEARTRLQAEDDQIHDELVRLADTDPLTGCLNVRAFNTRLTHEISLFDRYGFGCCLLIADVDLLKSYNDAHGHLAGDDALVTIGSALLAAARRSDVVARVGGDEFAILLPSTSIDVAEQVAEHLGDEIRSRNIEVTLSFGVAALDRDEPTVQRIFRDADAALYLAKVTGRARVVAHSKDHAHVRGQQHPNSEPSGSVENRDLLEFRVRQVERENAETDALMDALLETAPVGMCFADRNLRILRINEALCQFLTGAITERLKGRTIPDVVSPALWVQLEPVCVRVLETGLSMVVDDIVTAPRTESGRFRYWHSTFFPVRVAEGITGLGVIAVDITDQRELQDVERGLIRSAVGALGAAVEARDPYTFGHQQSVALIAAAVAAELGLEPRLVDEVELAARIHDLGKVRVPSEILARPGRLTDAEMALVREHPRVGAEILASVDFPEAIREMVLQHHERMNGSGYPLGLIGSEISIGARVIAVADVLDSMASARPYRSALGHDAAMAEIESKRDVLYDGDVVDACVRLFRQHKLSLNPREWGEPVERSGDQASSSATTPANGRANEGRRTRLGNRIHRRNLLGVAETDP